MKAEGSLLTGERSPWQPCRPASWQEGGLAEQQTWVPTRERARQAGRWARGWAVAAPGAGPWDVGQEHVPSEECGDRGPARTPWAEQERALTLPACLAPPSPPSGQGDTPRPFWTSLPTLAALQGRLHLLKWLRRPCSPPGRPLQSQQAPPPAGRLRPGSEGSPAAQGLGEASNQVRPCTSARLPAGPDHPSCAHVRRRPTLVCPISGGLFSTTRNLPLGGMSFSLSFRTSVNQLSRKEWPPRFHVPRGSIKGNGASSQGERVPDAELFRNVPLHPSLDHMGMHFALVSSTSRPASSTQPHPQQGRHQPRLSRDDGMF